MIRKLLALVLPDEWEGHYDYCAVFIDDHAGLLVASGWSCSEDCINHPGTKVLLGKYTSRVRET